MRKQERAKSFHGSGLHGHCLTFVKSIAVIALALGAGLASPALAQLTEDCTATILNRQVQLSPDGTFAIGNVPVPTGAFRVRIVCARETGLGKAQSNFVVGVPDGATIFDGITFFEIAPIPVSLAIDSPSPVLTPTAPNAQLVTTGILTDGTAIDLTLGQTGTSYLFSNPAIATVSADGLVSAVSSGNVLITATHEGVIGTIALTVALSTDGDGDGIPDDFEQANAVNPGGANLVLLPGTQITASSFSPGNSPILAIDGDLQTSWFTASGDAANLGASNSGRDPFLPVPGGY